MLTCIDIGCVEHGEEESIQHLIDAHHPDLLLGFDPLAHDGLEQINGTWVVTRQMAAWTEITTLTFLERGMCSGVVDREDHDGVSVQAFDVASLIWSLPGDLILKLDCEGSEYPILHHLIDTKADSRLKLALVEWHEGQDRHDHAGDQGFILEHFGAPIKKWDSMAGVA